MPDGGAAGRWQKRDQGRGSPATASAPSRRIEEALAALRALDAPALRRRWGEVFGGPPPKHFRRDLLLRALAYHAQAAALGGLRPDTRRRLAQAAAGRMPIVASPAVKPGTRLLRQWQGVTHEVIVLEKGVRYRGETWASLSAVARAIAGARWSGPRFFGLTGR